MSLKALRVEGTGLSAALAASVALNRGYPVEFLLHDSGHFVPSWKSVVIGSQRFDNGYHAIDVARAQNLAQLLFLDLKLPLQLDTRDTGIAAPGTDIFRERRERAPERSRAAQAIPVKNLDSMDEELPSFQREKLRIISRRYSDEWNSCRHLMLPWFLDPPVLLASEDEGDIYRNLLASGLLLPSRLLPLGSPFEEIGANWKEEMKRRGMVFGTLRQNPESRSSPQWTRAFYLTIFEVEEGDSLPFAEVLVASADVPGLARLSMHRRGSQDFLMCESFHLLGEGPNVTALTKFIRSELSLEINFMESVQTRKFALTGPRHGAGFEVEQDEDVTRLRFLSGGPVNMAKAEKTALRALEQVDA